ncbi:hypothetical protein [Sphingobacterium thalpophilum]|uniref:Tetratricopeptide repeat protein n=1 Tax=Sphingobacterium thalpophilum TaxID=259 RepID=A0A4U9UMQ1_9SPHI|nr:hypothetical protein [Sphingobacterium thalpophilum]VTR33142.1 Uncharacterised protein [Sphingobacterium thalpophilum]
MALSNHELFSQVINQPGAVEEDVILALIEKYPYVQGLRFVYERKIFEEHKAVQNLSSTLLYASSPNWLYEFMHRKPGTQTASAPMDNVLEDEDRIAEERMQILGEEAEVEVVEILDAVSAVEAATEAETIPAKGDIDELDRLIQAGVAQDYFRSEEQYRNTEQQHSEAEEPHKEAENQSEVSTVESGDAAVIPSVTATGQERVSVYDDDTMPYSFLWWLHKTRLEYAETYQPYVKSPLRRMTPSHDDIAKIHEKLDSQLLDQQIRENIFHLQSPEAKLSDAVKTTIAFQIPRKTDEVIEKFIREEPMIQPLQAEKLDLENKARKSSEDQYSLVTETLAKIYTEQGLYPKAIEVYKKLVLKYPEKNAYFAARITELEKKLN